MLSVAIPVALAMLAAALLLNVWRLVRGPSVVDRITALDTMAVNAVALLVLLGVQRGSALYFEAALIIAMVGFVSTVALCKYVLRGDIIE
jgi:multicomponent K+:H+ antiporter subunit F